jgi:ParB-like chromosome segregation protein Spo0J
MTKAVLASTPVGKLRRSTTPVIASAAGVTLSDAVAELLDLYAAGVVGRKERCGHESWWRWPTVDSEDGGGAVEAQETLDLRLADAGPDPRRAGIVGMARAVFQELSSLPEGERMDAINEIRLALREHSPMRREPVDCVLWVPQDQVHANSYNPNTVARPEMELLKLSIMSDGYTQPIVAWADDDGGDSYEIVDGFHRNRVAREVGGVAKRVGGRLPITVINGDRSAKEDRIAATIRHNRARGVHQVDAMSEIVLDLARRNWSDARIGKELGMEPDEVLRLKQVTGLAEMFADEEFSEAWEAAT